MASSGTSTGGKRRGYQFGPRSLAPLPKRTYDLTDEEIQAKCRADLDAHFAPKSPPPPKEKVSEDVVEHFIRMAKEPAPKPVDSDYERQLRKAHLAKKKKESSSSSSQGAAAKKSGKTVPQLGEQAVQSIPPLIVPTHVSTGAADELVITDDHRRMAAEAGVTVYQLLDIEPMDKIREEDVKRKYARGEPLVKPEEVKKLPTRMYELHEWYMKIAKTTNRESLMVKVKAEHYFHENALYVEFTELFQLFNQDALDKSIVSCYCL
jgi:hypothetical protein